MIAFFVLLILVGLGMICQALAVFLNAYRDARHGRNIRVDLHSYRPPPPRQ